MVNLFESLYSQLRHSTRASDRNCREVADRIIQEVQRICDQSDRIQASGDVETWAKTLAHHRLKQILRYDQLGSNRGRIELQSLLSAIVYRYITPSQGATSYQARITIIEDFLQGFYVEALNNFRRENQLNPTYSPRSLLELAEYMGFCERYAKRRIPLSGRRSQQLIILRAQSFAHKQPPETLVDMDSVGENGAGDGERDRTDPIIQQLRSTLADPNGLLPDSTLRETVVEQLIEYLLKREQKDCVDYFVLRLQDLSANEIEQILGLNARERDYLQQRFKYHLIRFALSHNWELVHQWLEADLERNLGLTSQQWQLFQSKLNPKQTQLLELKRQGSHASDIARALGLTVTQVEKQWFKLLELAWDIRNRSVS